MKNLKKALALTVAAVSVFGTIASAAPDMTVFCPTTANNAGKALYDTSFGWGSAGVSACKTHEKSYNAETDSIILTSKRTSNTATDTSLMHREGVYGHAQQTLATVGNMSAELDFKLLGVNIDGNPETTEIKQILNSFTVGMGVGYIANGGSSVSYSQNNTGIGVGSAYWKEDGTVYDWETNHYADKKIKLNLCGKQSTGFDIPVGNVVSLQLQVNTFDDCAKLTAYDKTADVILDSVEVKPEDGIDIVYVHNGFNVIMQDVFSFELCQAKYTRQRYVAYDQAVTAADTTVTATAKLAKNDNDAIERKAQAVLVQYDENGRFLSATASDVTTITSDVPGATTAVTKDEAQNPVALGTLSVTAEKAEGYDHAKVLVWDSVDAMNPIANVFAN